jgi:hypothetical protein
VSLYYICKGPLGTIAHWPKAGGVDDQDPAIVYGFTALNVAFGKNEAANIAKLKLGS